MSYPYGNCQFCGNEVNLIHSKEIYNGRDFGWLYACKCGAYVGCHKGTTISKGTVADPITREARKLAHSCFDPLWQKKGMSRSQAYKLAQRLMNKTPEQMHIGLLTKTECLELIEKLTDHLKQQQNGK